MREAAFVCASHAVIFRRGVMKGVVKGFNVGFSRLAKSFSLALGHPLAFAVASLVVVLWAISGPLFGYSDTWQLVINTGTTIVTFFMVF
jgi:low affinity Fe/Cu permease